MCCFSAGTSLSTSPLRTVELFQAGLARVAYTTYVGRLFSLSASSAAARWPPRGEPLVTSPAAGPEAFVTGRVLDDSVERDVLARDDLSHFGSAPRRSSGNQTL